MEAWASQEKARTLADRKMFDLPLRTFLVQLCDESAGLLCICDSIYEKATQASTPKQELRLAAAHVRSATTLAWVRACKKLAIDKLTNGRKRNVV